ncbi:MAG: hypothetical protein HYU88_10335 [Chloroflexi bacterium]|nr:hypothetical protein [Chloroflexota bacterium]
MDESPYNIRLATPADADTLRRSIRFTLSSPEGKGQRKQYRDGVERSEVLVLEHSEPKDRRRTIDGFLEWHTRIDGTVTIRDAGTIGDEVKPGVIKRLVREMLRIYQPPLVRAKTRRDQEVWTNIFRELPGFEPEGVEYARPYWRILWAWSAERAREQVPRRELGRPRGGR